MNFPSRPPRPSIPPSLSQIPLALDEFDFLDDDGLDGYERQTAEYFASPSKLS